MSLRDELNPEQAEAASWPEGPLLILAGAGSGKTRVLIYRVMFLASEAGIDPSSVLAVTFTNKAAAEMRSRLAAKIGEPAAKRAWFHTFHGACLRILRREIEGRLKGYSRDFGIFDGDDQLKVVKSVMARADVSDTLFTPRTLLSRIHDCKNRMVDPETFARTAVDFTDEAVAKVYPRYQAALRENNAVDFDDIILLAVRLFEEHPAILEDYQRKFRHILVDEYQDTNQAQYRLITALAAAHRNLACVGDDDQGIYAWRGADIRNILDFQKDYPDAKVVKLVRNYRSTKNVLRAAMAVIARNTGRYGKELWTENPTGSPVRIHQARDERDEGRWITDEIQRLGADHCPRVRASPGDSSPFGLPGGTPPNPLPDPSGEGHARRDVAIFYRTNAQSRALEEALRARGLPYRLVGALRFFDRAEIKDVLAYLRTCVNPADSVALKRILNVPPRAIGKTTVERIENFAERNRLAFPDAVHRVEEIDEVKPAARKRIAEFDRTMAELREDARTMAPAAFLRRMVDQTGYLEWLGRSGAVADGDDLAARVENVGQLIASASEFSMENPDATVAGFLDQVSLVSDVDNLDKGLGEATDGTRPEPSADAVTLMTFHAAKGLEFPVVFMTGMEEGIFPHARTLGPDAGVKALEEERRLCYVGMTRARRLLYLTHVRERASWGARRPASPSRFLDELPREIVSESHAAGEPGFRAAGAASFARSRSDGTYDQRPPRADEFDQRPAWDDELPVTRPFAPSAPSPSAGGWKRGMRIVHAHFGQGRIQAVEGGGPNAKLSVEFEQGGVRKLLLKFAGKDIRSAD